MRKTLRKKDIKALLSEVEKYNFSKKDNYVVEDDILLINNKPMFFYYEKRIVPMLKLVLMKNFLKKITVDMGAVKFVVNGADIMRPGITAIEDGIQKDDIIVIIDETHNKPLAIGIALYSSSEMKKMDCGKVVKNIHYVGDRLWDFS